MSIAYTIFDAISAISYTQIVAKTSRLMAMPVSWIEGVKTMDDILKPASTSVSGNAQSQVRRRSLIAGAAAIAVGLFARSSTEVSAADGGNLILGVGGVANNTATGTTTLTDTSGATAAFVVKNANYGGTVDSTADGVQGFTAGTANSGLLGRNDDLNGVGVYGIASNGTGVAAQSVGGSAVSGSSTSGAGGYHTSVSGYGSYNSSASSFGVVGASTSNTGVYGVSGSGVGVTGVSGGGSAPFGVVGTVTSAPGFALYGVVNVAGTVGFAGGAGVAGAIAGQFAGPVNIYNSLAPNGTVIAPGNLYVQGNSTVIGAKSAAVPHPDGSLRLLYCVESPEAWFEDFGEGTVSGGKAEIKLDADFAAVVDTSKLHVFLTETGGHAGLHITAKNTGSFTVEASPSLAKAAGVTVGSVSSSFSYRVVAKRKDMNLGRLATFVVPKEIKVAPPKIATPAAPVAPQRHADGNPSKKH